MKRTTWRACRGYSLALALCVLGLTWALTSAGASAQDLVVVLSSPEDQASADKLAELIREPFLRVEAASLPASPPTAAVACRTHARLELHLDSVGQTVRLVRCSDATVLARGVDPEAARQTPYLSAFVAAELLGINRELEAATARSSVGEVASSEVAEVAAVSGGVALPSPSPSPSPALASTSTSTSARLSLQIRAGAELTLWGAPFDHAVRPSFGVGVSFATNSPAFAWVFELQAGLFAAAEVRRAAELLELQRHDGALHAGARLLLGPLHVSVFALGRASLTRAEYRADLPVISYPVRFGVGAGVEADMPLSASFAVYTQVKLDVATSRGEYRIPGRSLALDPASLFWVGMGLLLRFSL